MIILVCAHCSHAIRVASLQKGEIESLFFTLPEWPKVTCPYCQEPALAYADKEVSAAAQQLLQIRELTPIEAHAALLGLGFPEDRECTQAQVQELLIGTPIRRVVGSDVPGTGRVCVDYLELWDGTRVYLGSSSHGAVIYRIARPHSYAKANHG